MCSISWPTPTIREDNRAALLSGAERAKLAIEREKELRLYYDRRAGDYLDVGFRLCEHAEWVELHRCLLVREFQVLVLGHIRTGVTFGRRPIEEFADVVHLPGGSGWARASGSVPAQQAGAACCREAGIGIGGVVLDRQIASLRGDYVENVRDARDD